MHSKRVEKIQEGIDRIPLRALFLFGLVIVAIFWSLSLAKIYVAGTDYPYGGKYYFHTDDVGQSNVIYDWQHGYRAGGKVGDDNWFIKYPLYLVTNNLPISPAKRIFLNSWAVIMITAVLVLYVLFELTKIIIKDIRKKKWAILIASLALAFLPIQAFETIKMSNSRNIEIGIFMFLLLALFYFENKLSWFAEGSKFKKTKVIILATVFAILCADDPLFIYMTLMPFVLIVAFLYFVGKYDIKKTIKLIAFSLVSLLGAIFTKSFLSIISPLEYYNHPNVIASFDMIKHNTSYFLNTGFGIIGVDLYAKKPTNSIAILSVMMLFIAVVSLWAIITSLKNEKKLPNLYIALLIFWIPLIQIASLNLNTGETNRYLILLPFLVIIGLIYFVKYSKYLRQLVIVFVIVTMSGLILSKTKVSAVLYDRAQPTNAQNYSTIDVLKNERLNKGYAPGERAGINRFLSNQSIMIYPVICHKGKLYVRDLFHDKAHSQELAKESFYIYNPKDFGGSTCQLDSIINQFGFPEREPNVDFNKSERILVYNYDIKTKMKYLR